MTCMDMKRLPEPGNVIVNRRGGQIERAEGLERVAIEPNDGLVVDGSRPAAVTEFADACLLGVDGDSAA
jgi:hypothetical protein